MGQGWHQTSRRLYIFLWKGDQNNELGTGFFLYTEESYLQLVVGCRT
jgi:hypothetical protein